MNASSGPVRKWSVRLLDWLVWRPIAWCTRQCYRFTRWVLSPRIWLRFFSWLRFSSISLRRWLFIALVVLMVLPGSEPGWWPSGSRFSISPQPTATEQMLRDNGARWTDPDWQAELKPKRNRTMRRSCSTRMASRSSAPTGSRYRSPVNDGGIITIVPNSTAPIRPPLFAWSTIRTNGTFLSRSPTSSSWR